MLRSFLIYMSKANWAKRMITNWQFSWKVASRFVAGDTLNEAIRVIQELNDRRTIATVDHLGENTTNANESELATDAIVNIINQINESHLSSNVSIKLSQIGLSIDERLCERNLFRILQNAKEQNNFVRLDMEDSGYVDATLRLYRLMRHQNNFENVGVVIQSSLYRSSQDIDQLMDIGAKVRLCKGAYKESEHIAYPRKRDVDKHYDILAKKLIEGAKSHGSPPVSPDGRIPPLCAFATHDPARVSFVVEYASQVGLPKDALEFQMLYGIRRDIQKSVQDEGYPVRIYVPFGTQWYPYFVRRLAERPANLWFFVSNLFRK